VHTASAHAPIAIVPIPILPFGVVNAFALLGKHGVVLVDAGLPGRQARFEKALARHGKTLRDVTLIIVTHGHIDHAGGADALRSVSGAPIVAHRNELPFLRGDLLMRFCPTGWFGRVFLRAGAPTQPYPRFEADIVLDDDPLDLAPFGVDGRLEPTPGHTPGSLSVLMPDGAALVGDMLAGGLLLGGIAWHGRAKQPPFEEEPHVVAHEIHRLVEAGAKTFYLGHGGPVSAAEARRHAHRLGEIGCSTPPTEITPAAPNS